MAMNLREEIRRLAEEAWLHQRDSSNPEDHITATEFAILEGVKLVLEREPSNAASEAFSKSWLEITMPAQTWPERLHRAYRAMTQELLKELESGRSD